jgi:hypothetical protein
VEENGVRILYVARHGQPNADDEGAITHALTQLGHDVIRFGEEEGWKARKTRADFCLSHKWDDVHAMRAIHCPKVFWWFDLVNYPDSTLNARCSQRVTWMSEVVPEVLVGFCTDGDWVSRDTTGKLVWLTQGADERVVGVGKKTVNIDVLFTGYNRNCGEGRESFVREVRERYGKKFHHVERGIYGRELADLIASSKVVVAPDHPVTDRYWSNRVYTTLGFGGFLLHPYAEGLWKQYTPGIHLVTYRNRSELFYYIDRMVADRETATTVSQLGLRRTITHHLYRHRCEELVKIVKERL